MLTALLTTRVANRTTKQPLSLIMKHQLKQLVKPNKLMLVIKRRLESNKYAKRNTLKLLTNKDRAASLTLIRPAMHLSARTYISH